MFINKEIAQACAAIYGQCGGIGWSGPTCCDAGSVCTVSNEYYSQCVPGSQQPPAATSTIAQPTPVTSTVDQPTITSPPSFNPFAGAAGFVNYEYNDQVDSSIALEPSIKEAAEVVKKQPSAIWIDTMANLVRLEKALPEASKQASAEKPVVITFVVYDLPGRDCNALASNGEIPAGDLDTYKTKYIDPYAATLKKYYDPNVRVVLIIEPDSLPNLATNLGNPRCQAAQKDYTEGIAYALSKLTLPNVYMYVDIAHGGWLGWTDNTRKIVPIVQQVLKMATDLNPAVKINGFASNVSNYSPFRGNGASPEIGRPVQNENGILKYQGNPAIDENLYTQNLAAAFGPAGLPTRFLVDTSRSGRTGIRQAWGSWCNIKGAGIGLLPTVNPTPLLDAFVWIKPPGESDGVSGPPGTPRLDGFCDPTTYNGRDSLDGAPQAGKWFHEQFVMLVKNANPPLV